MKLTKSQLKQIIKEEIAKVSESPAFADDPYKEIGTSETIHDAAVDNLVLGHPIGGDLLNRLDMIDRDKPEERQQVYVGLMKAADKARRFVEQGFDGPSIVEEGSDLAQQKLVKNEKAMHILEKHHGRDAPMIKALVELAAAYGRDGDDPMDAVISFYHGVNP